MFTVGYFALCEKIIADLKYRVSSKMLDFYKTAREKSVSKNVPMQYYPHLA